MTEDPKLAVRSALAKAWSRETSVTFDEAMHPSYGQCAQTAIVIQEIFGGQILKTTGWPPSGRHFYNMIGGARIDFTADQFSFNPTYCTSIEYLDEVSSAQDAITETTELQVSKLRDEFKSAFCCSTSASSKPNQ